MGGAGVLHNSFITKTKKERNINEGKLLLLGICIFYNPIWVFNISFLSKKLFKLKFEEQCVCVCMRTAAVLATKNQNPKQISFILSPWSSFNTNKNQTKAKYNLFRFDFNYFHSPRCDNRRTRGYDIVISDFIASPSWAEQPRRMEG